MQRMTENMAGLDAVSAHDIGCPMNVDQGNGVLSGNRLRLTFFSGESMTPAETSAETNQSKDVFSFIKPILVNNQTL